MLAPRGVSTGRWYPVGANEHHVFNFRDASAEFGIQPASAPPGSFPMVAGIDGRFADVLRRYPGHIRYPDTSGALGCTPTADVFIPDFVEPFEIQKQSGSLDKVRGFAVYDEHVGNFELWYRFNTDAAGTIRKYSLVQTGGLLFRTTADPRVDHTPQPAASGVGELPAIFNGSVYTAQQVICMTVHDDGDGYALYAAGIFRFAGDRHCQCIAKWDGTRWNPIPDSYFTGPIICMASHDGKLYVGGLFTSKGSRSGGQDASFKYVACYSKASGWETLGGGTDGAVRAMASLGTGQGLVIGGDFGNVETDPGDTPNEVSIRLAIWNPTPKTWTKSTMAVTGGNVYALAYGATLVVGGSFTLINGTANTVRVCQLATDLSSVTALGTGASSGTVYALKFQGTKLYAGGDFAQLGGVANTASFGRYNAGWQAVSSGLTSGTVRSIDFRDVGGGVYTFIITGSSLVTGGLTRPIWYNHADVFGTFGGWTYPVNLPTTLTDILCQVEWNSFRYYGGIDQSTVLAMNPLQSPMSSAQLPTAVGPKVDIAYHDRYIFLGASNGVKKVLYWDVTTTSFGVASFGPGLMYADGANQYDITAQAGTGRLVTGNYGSNYRYFDPDRVRWTSLSTPNAEIGDITPYYMLLDLQGTANELSKAPEGYTKTEVFSTISSTDEDIPSGGSIYRVGRGSLNTTTRRSTAWLGADDFVDYGNGEFHWAIADASIPDPGRIYDLDLEETGELNDVYALGIYQGLTFALENQGGFLVLRWTNTFRTEWESFPPLNGYQTGIRSEDGWSCKFTVAGDFLYLTGGDQIYRIQRVGVSVSIIKVFSGLSIIHRQAVCVVGNQMYIATAQGLLVVDPRSASGAILQRLSRVFWDRWRGWMTPADTTFSVSIAYDAQMECLYIHNTALKEAICLWLNTGKTTIIFNTAAEICCSFPDIDSDQGTRAYFFTNRRWFHFPQWTQSQALTMQGSFLYATGTASELMKYNAAVATVTHGDTGCPNYSGARTKLRFSGTGASTGVFPFTTDGTAGTAVCVSPMALQVLSGNSKGKIFQVVGNNHREVWLAEDNADITAADQVALAPVTTLIMGSMLWNERGAIQPSARKRHLGHSITVTRLTSPTALSQLTPLAGGSLVQFGTIRQDNFAASEPASSVLVTNSDKSDSEYHGPNNSHFITPYAALDGPLSVALSTSKEAANWTRKTSDGTIVFPFLTFRTSNYGVEVLYWDVLGTVEAASLAGPGTL